MTFQNTKLWTDTLAEREGDGDRQPRELLRSQLLRMRERVSQLISHIPVDCRDLTVHDVTHLDALWESAQQICGTDWELNPAEAFVFGAAVLIHDAGLTTLAYPKGKEGLRNTTQWADIAAPYLNGGSNSQLNAGLDEEHEASILFEVLRTLHADQATELCLQTWDLEGTGPQHLIEDSELRMAFGESIGRIAASHHWSPDRIQAELSTQLGGSPSLPDWTINEVKLACLIRCADAAQVDRTRAPLLMYAALKPQGYSELHWRAQSKLNRSTLKDDAIHFTSASAFKDHEADAWWIAFDLANILDKELRATNAILTDIGERTFAAQRVAGAGSPGTFSKHVRTNKWRPIDASVRVTDPLGLAKSLGGRNLYGPTRFVPFRELIQNSADAIQARRALQGRGQDFGLIRITVERSPIDEETCHIHVDDNGIGMSERVLTTTLVDFGKSFWSSDIIRQEFPGLKSSNVRHIGRFGIGFFSIFDISQEVRVISRRYDAGHNDTRILDFRGLVTRPLLREAKGDDLPQDVNTRITIVVPKSFIENPMSQEDGNSHFERQALHRQSLGYRNARPKLRNTLQGLVSFLDIRVDFSDRRNGDTFVHSPNIYEKCPKELIDELPMNDTDKSTKHFDASASMRPLRSSDGDAFGRAALDIDAILKNSTDSRAFVSVGGVVSRLGRSEIKGKTNVEIPYFGVVEGKPERAARDVFSNIVPQEVVCEWLKEQLKDIDKRLLRKSEIMSIASFAYSVTNEDSSLPFAFQKGNGITTSQLSLLGSRISRFSLPVSWRYDTWLELIGYNTLRPEYFEAELAEEVIVLAEGIDRILGEDIAKQLKKEGGGIIDREDLNLRFRHIRNFIDIVEGTWGNQAIIRLTTRPVFSTNIASLSGERWVISVESNK